MAATHTPTPAREKPRHFRRGFSYGSSDGLHPAHFERQGVGSIVRPHSRRIDIRHAFPEVISVVAVCLVVDHRDIVGAFLGAALGRQITLRLPRYELPRDYLRTLF